MAVWVFMEGEKKRRETESASEEVDGASTGSRNRWKRMRRGWGGGGGVL